MESAPIFHKIDQQAIQRISQIKTVQKIISPIEQIQSLIQQKFELPHYNSSVYTSQQQAFLDVLNQAEGKQNSFYKDNKGIAIAYGWNPTRNSLQFNTMIAQKADLNSQEIKAIQAISNNHNIHEVPKDLKNIRLSNQQMNNIAIALMPYYEEQFLDAMIYQSILKGRNYQKDLDAYFHLPDQQKAVLTHMAYKVGFLNLLHYQKFYQSFFHYLDNPSQRNLNNVDSNFTYTYQIADGERLHDTRVENLHKIIFSEVKTKEQVAFNIQKYRSNNLSKKYEI
jgi:hypothetical protein